ncbi:MAG: hypothetical protein ACD_10C00086G0001, partial [uncultured bacterium]
MCAVREPPEVRCAVVNQKQQTESSQADGKTMDRRYGACRFRSRGSGDGTQ